MVRCITAKADGITITAKVKIRNEFLTAREIEKLRDEIADRIQEAAAELPYIGVARNRIKIK